MWRKRQLYIDLDGVLADMDTYYEQQFGEKIGRAANIKDPDGMWDKIRQHGHFYADLPLMSDALELWEGAKRFHPNPIILTGIPHSIPECEKQKRGWVSRHLGKFIPVICCRSADKWKYCVPGDILIDDWVKYRELWEERGGIFIVHRSAEESLKELEKYFNGTI